MHNIHRRAGALTLLMLAIGALLAHSTLLSGASGASQTLPTAAEPASTETAPLLPPLAVSSVAWSPDGATIALGGSFGIELYSAALNPLPKLPGAIDTVFSLAWSPDSSMLASVDAAQQVTIWSMVAGMPPRRLDGTGSAITDAAWSPDGQLLAVSSVDRAITLWDTQTWTRREPAPVYPGSRYIQALAWHPTDSRLAGADAGHLYVWNSPAGLPSPPIALADNPHHSLGWGFQGRRLVLPGASLWDSTTGQEYGDLSLCSSGADTVAAVGPDGYRIAAAGFAKDGASACINHYDSQGFQVAQTFLRTHQEFEAISALAWNPNGSAIVSATQRGWLHVWDATSGELLATAPRPNLLPEELHTQIIHCVPNDDLEFRLAKQLADQQYDQFSAGVQSETGRLIQQACAQQLQATAAFLRANPLPAGNFQPPVQALTLEARCSPDPAVYRAWRVSNPNPSSVQFAWSWDQQPALPGGTLVVRAAVAGQPGVWDFQVPTQTGANDLRITSGTFTVAAPGNAARCDQLTTTPSNTPTRTATNTPLPTNTPTRTATNTPLPTNTPTHTASNTPLPTNTPTRTTTNTPLPTNTPTHTASNTPLPTNTPTRTTTNTPLPTNTPTRTATNTPLPTATPTRTATNTPSRTPTSTSLPTNTPTRTATSTLLPTATPTRTATNTPLPTSTPASTAVPTCQPNRPPLDIVLLFDRSTSMQGDRLAQAQQAAKSLVQQLTMATDQVAVVSFATDSRLDLPLSHDPVAIEQAIDALVASGGTRLDLGITMARDELNSARRRPTARTIIITIAAAMPMEGPVVTAADTAKLDGIWLLTVGFEQSANWQLLQFIASRPSDYFAALDPAALQQIYLAIADIAQCDPPAEIPGPYAAPLVRSGSASTGTISFRAVGKFQLDFTAGSAWQPTRWFDRTLSNSLDLANKNGPSPNYNALHGPVEFMYNGNWYSLSYAQNARITIIEENSTRAIVQTEFYLRPATTNFLIRANYTIYASGRVAVELSLQNSTSTARFLQRVEYAFISLEQHGWATELLLQNHAIGFRRTGGSSPRSNLLAVNPSADTLIDTDEPYNLDPFVNRYWFVTNQNLAAGASFQRTWEFQLSPGGQSSSSLTARASDLRSPGLVVAQGGSPIGTGYRPAQGAYALQANGSLLSFYPTAAQPRHDLAFVIEGWQAPAWELLLNGSVLAGSRQPAGQQALGSYDPATQRLVIQYIGTLPSSATSDQRTFTIRALQE